MFHLSDGSLQFEEGRMSVLDGLELFLSCRRLLEDGRTEDTDISCRQQILEEQSEDTVKTPTVVYFLLNLLSGQAVVRNSDIFCQRCLCLLSELDLKSII